MPRPTLSVLTAIHERGGVAAAVLSFLRPHADEIIVAFDSRTPRDQLGPLESIADALIGFEFSGRNRFWPWLAEQARGEWLLILDGDEVVSDELLHALPALMARKDVSGYSLPCWWLFPDSAHRLIGPPWDRDTHLRLVRNDGLLWIPGTPHTGTVTAGPARSIDAPFLHLDLLLNSEACRAEKVRRYNETQFLMFAPDGRLMNETYYLPERNPPVLTGPLPPADAARAAAVLAQKDAPGFTPTGPPEVVPAKEVEKWWTGRPAEDVDGRAALDIVRGETSVLAGATVQFDLDLANLGRSVWFASVPPHRGPPLHVAYHLEAADGSAALWDGQRSALLSRVLPGERVRVGATVRMPSAPGRYKLTFDLVLEGVRWFGIDRRIEIEVAPPPLELVKTVAGHRLVSLDSARVTRLRLRGADSLADLLGPPADKAPAGAGPDGYPMQEAALDFLREWIGREGFGHILEFGSGASTVALAREIGPRGGRLLSFEEDGRFAERTRELLAGCSAGEAAEVVTAPLVEMTLGGLTTRCYGFDTNLRRKIAALDPDLVVIDGPSGAAGGSRLAIAIEIAPLLNRRTPFVMDDAFRDAELEIAGRWRADPQIEVDGLLILGRGFLMGHLRRG